MASQKFITKRILHEYQNLALYLMDGDARVALSEDDDRALPSILFEVPITDGCYKGQKHIVKMDLIWGPNNENVFPDKGMSFPLCHIETPIWHPNIDKAGNICVSILTADGWNPLYSLETVVGSIIVLLNTPNPDSPQWKEPASDFINMKLEEFQVKSKKYYDDNVDEKQFEVFRDWTPERLYTSMGGKQADLEKRIADRKKSEQAEKDEAEKLKQISDDLDDLDF